MYMSFKFSCTIPQTIIVITTIRIVINTRDSVEMTSHVRLQFLSFKYQNFEMEEVFLL